MINIFCTSFGCVIDRKAVRYSIANYAPAPFKSLPVVSIFIPARSIVANYKNNRITWEQYTETYVSGLRARYTDIVELLKTISVRQRCNIELCCWENRQHKHCHRAVVSDIINKTVAFEHIENVLASVHDLNGVK